MLGSLRGNGFPVVLATHASSAIDAYISVCCGVAPGIGLLAEAYPHLAEMLAELVVGKTYSYADKFNYGLG